MFSLLYSYLRPEISLNLVTHIFETDDLPDTKIQKLTPVLTCETITAFIVLLGALTPLVLSQAKMIPSLSDALKITCYAGSAVAGADLLVCAIYRMVRSSKPLPSSEDMHRSHSLDDDFP